METGKASVAGAAFRDRARCNGAAPSYRRAVMRSGGGTRRATGKGAARDLDAVTLAMQMLADGTRLRILQMLAEGEMSVTAMQGRLRCPQPTVSHHLGLLKLVGCVHARRAGKRVYYRLPEAPPASGTVRITAGGATILVDMRAR